MKIAVYAAVLLLESFSHNLLAQTELVAGLLSASGNISIETQYDDGSLDRYRMTIAPSVGLFINSHIQILVGLDYNYYMYPKNDARSANASKFVMVGGRYYQTTAIGPIYIGGQLNYRAFSPESYGNRSAIAQVGLLYFLGQRFALDLGLAREVDLDFKSSSKIILGSSAAVFFTL